MSVLRPSRSIRSARSALRPREADWARIEQDTIAVASRRLLVVIEAVAEPLGRKLTAACAFPPSASVRARLRRAILVLEDMLGLSPRVPKFVKRYGDLGLGIEKRWPITPPTCARALFRARARLSMKGKKA